MYKELAANFTALNLGGKYGSVRHIGPGSRHPRPARMSCPNQSNWLIPLFFGMALSVGVVMSLLPYSSART